MSCGVGRTSSLDLVLLWLWHRLATVAPIQPLAWEPPNAVGAALEIGKKKEVRSQCFHYHASDLDPPSPSNRKVSRTRAWHYQQCYATNTGILLARKRGGWLLYSGTHGAWGHFLRAR